jgi:PAS domain S-box-containing protein
MTDAPLILIVDDNVLLQEATVWVLSQAGYRTCTADDGQAALRVACAEKPDLVLLDMVLPDLNGLEVCRRLKAAPALTGCFVVMLSSMAVDSPSQIEGLEGGADGYITRPISSDELLARVRGLLRIKLAEDQLRISEDKFKHVFDYSTAGKSITLPSGEMNVNRALCDMLGYTQEELQNQRWQDITHPDDIEPNQKALAPLLSGEKETVRFTKRYLHKNGSSVWAEVGSALRRDKDGQPQYFITTINDITARQQAEMLLQESHDRYEAIFEATGTATLLVEADTTIIAANRECLSLTGYRSEELLGTKWPRYVAPESLEIMLKFHNLRRENPGQAPDKYEVKLVDKQGKNRVAILNIGLISGTGQSVVSMLDITERQRAEEQIKRQLDELQRWQDVMLGREDRVQELKREVNTLCRRLGEPVRYPSQEAGPADSKEGVA